MLAARSVSKAFGGAPILDDVSLRIAPGQRVGVVGPNGIGKSTLLRILAGIEPPDSGLVERSPLTATVGFLPQELDAREGETLRAYLARRTGVTDAERALADSSDALSRDSSAADAYSEALDRFLAVGGGDFEARIGQVGADVGLEPERLDLPMVSLSGGEFARAALAAILLSRFDVLLLDEPTNNLDFAGLAQLERFVAGTPGACVIVSHDRAFLDATVERILEIEEHTHRAVEFAGSVDGVRRGPGSGSSPRVRTSRRVRGPARGSDHQGSDAARLVRGGQAEGRTEFRARQVDPELQVATQRATGCEGPDDRSGNRTARGRRETVGGMGTPHGTDADQSQRVGRGEARGRSGPARELHARADRP